MMKNKIYPKFIVKFSAWKWSNPKQFVVHQWLSMSRCKAFNEEYDRISLERIKNVWNIEPTYVFWLKIGRYVYEFHPKGNNTYGSAIGICEFTLKDVDLSKNELDDITIYYIPQGIDGLREKDMSKWIAIPNTEIQKPKNCIHFSSKNGDRWIGNTRYKNYTADLVIDKTNGIKWIEY